MRSGGEQTPTNIALRLSAVQPVIAAAAVDQSYSYIRLKYLKEVVATACCSVVVRYGMVLMFNVG